jgi:curved DNA-binding protein CbpA
VLPSADEKKLKVAYLRAAKKYHPDIYKGVNQ